MDAIKTAIAKAKKSETTTPETKIFRIFIRSEPILVRKHLFSNETKGIDMKNIKKLSQAGFTLVELMVVVAIIGVLATIAIPQYNKFTAKARQSEAKITMGAVGNVESVFAVENNSYTSCLGSIGFAREGSKFYYYVGFDTMPASTCGSPGTLPCSGLSFINTAGTWTVGASCATTLTANEHYFEATTGDGSFVTRAGGRPATTGLSSVTGTTYVVSSQGYILAGATNNDTWTIDQNKNVTNVKSGLLK